MSLRNHPDSPHTSQVVNQIHNYLREVADDMKNDRILLDEYTITKGLTKAPEEYSDAKTQPHVQAAMRMKAKGIPMRAGDHVPYVICQDASVTSFAQRAWDPESVEAANGGFLVPDTCFLLCVCIARIARGVWRRQKRFFALSFARGMRGDAVSEWTLDVAGCVLSLVLNIIIIIIILQ